MGFFIEIGNIFFVVKNSNNNSLAIDDDHE